MVLLTIVVPLSFFISCTRKKKDLVEYHFDPETSYTLKETNIETYISDSGITRFKMLTDTWLMFGKASEPYQYFPDGVYFEKFDTALNVEASIKADTAYYYERRKIWELVGHVDISNLKGERFQTSQLFWDTNLKTIYSDSFIRISREGGGVNTGIGFRSNEDMTVYEIYNSSADIPVDVQRRAIADTIPADSLPADQEQLSLENPSETAPTNDPDFPVSARHEPAIKSERE